MDIHLLLLDPMLPGAGIEKIVAGHIGFPVFNFQSELRKQLADTASVLTKELALHLDKGEAIPERLIEQLVKARLNQNQDVLISGFPKTIGQLEILLHLADALNFQVAKVWYIRHRNRESFVRQFLDSPERQLWTQKFDEDLMAKPAEDFAKYDHFVGQMQQAMKPENWKTVALDHTPESDNYIPALTETLKT